MENTFRRRSGYEPSDTENDWPETPRRVDRRPENGFRMEAPIHGPTHRRSSSKSPYKLHVHNSTVLDSDSDSHRNKSPLSHNISPLSRSQRRTTRTSIDGNADPFSKSERMNPTINRENLSPFAISERRTRVSPFRPNYISRAESAPKARFRERGKHMKYDQTKGEQQIPSGGEINEIFGSLKISRGLASNVSNLDSSDSITPGDIFFSKNNIGFQNGGMPKNGVQQTRQHLPKPPGFVERKNSMSKNSRTMSNSSAAISRQSSNLSVTSSRTSASTRKFVENRRKNPTETWFSCINKGSSCKKSNKSPEKGRTFDEAAFIGKAIVVESLRPFWADKHQPASLIGFTCHKQEAMLLQELAAGKKIPHILLKGPPGSGKKALTMALLHEIYGDNIWNISHDLRYFHVLESRPTKVVVPISSSPHHVELNVYLESKATYVLTALVKEISADHAATPEISTIGAKADFKVLVLYDVEKAEENIQHLIKWIMDCYSDSCKLVLCCEDDVDILESVKTRCKIVNVESPVTHEVMEVLIHIAKKEGFEISTSFAAKIASKSKHNVRRAIMALEACKAHKYPFAEDQPIPIGWEEALVELSVDSLSDPSPKRLFMVRTKIQKLLGDFIHPKLILLKLVEQFLPQVDANVKRELYYWYAYYDKRLPMGTSALLKLEEFVAKFMSMHRKSSSSRQFS